MASNIDLPSVESTSTDIIANGIIDKNLKNSYEWKKEISLLPSLNDRNESKELENSHTTNVLETKLVFLEKEIQFYIWSLKINKK